jgi:hypothetical protein
MGSNRDLAYNKSVQLLTAKYPESRKLGDIALRLSYNPTPASEKLLRAILEQNPDHDSKGKACFALGKYYGELAELVQQVKDDPTLATRVEQFYGKDTLAMLRERKPNVLRKDAESQYERTVREFADVKGQPRDAGQRGEERVVRDPQPGRWQSGPRDRG